MRNSPPSFPRFLRILAIVLLALAPVLHAADPTTIPTSQPTSKPSTNPSSISLNFKDAPLDKVLDLLSKSLGFSVVTDGPVDGHVTLISRQPVSADQAVAMLNAGLKANGFTVIRDGQMLRIVARDKARKGNLPVHFGNKVEDIADTDELITQVIPLTR
jgi:type II secretory pathway component GspD/PulD (secretin)